MWGRKKHRSSSDTDASYVPAPSPSYWATHPDPAQPLAGARAPGVTRFTSRSVSVTVNGKPIDIGSPEGHRVITMLAEKGQLTEQHVYETTQHATPDQQKQVMELLLQRKAGAISDTDFAARILAVMKPPPT